MCGGCVQDFWVPRTPLRRTALPLDRPKFRSFFSPLPPENSFISYLSGGLLVEFWFCLKTIKCARRGSHTTARELQTCTFQGTGASKKNRTKFHEKTPKREERKKIVAGREKKARNFGPRASFLGFEPPPLRAPHQNKKLAKTGLAKCSHGPQNTLDILNTLNKHPRHPRHPKHPRHPEHPKHPLLDLSGLFC